MLALLHKTIIMQWYFYLVYLCLCLGLGLFMSYLSDLFFICIFIFITINHIIIKTLLFFDCFLENYLLFLVYNVDEECK